ncbi:hypothetical protein RUND412_009954, partial [Rhizina undulata]
ASPKNSRRSSCLNGQPTTEEQPDVTPLNINTSPLSETSVDGTRARESSHASSDTHLASQIYCAPSNETGLEDELDEDIWGYLVPLDHYDSSGSNNNTNSKKMGIAKKFTLASGYIIGRSKECDVKIDCTFSQQEIYNSQPVAILANISTNGTKVGGVVVGLNNCLKLNTGDNMEVTGVAKFIFRYPRHIRTIDFHKTYERGKEIGSGNFGTVCKEVKRNSGLIVLSLHGAYYEEDGIYLVLKLACEWDLFNYLRKHEKLTKDETRTIFIQLFNAVEHERHILYRDIKPENILLCNKILSVKLTDFKLAIIIGKESFTTSM